jgi:2-methylaconitate cis-trans-isomerase PrpF
MTAMQTKIPAVIMRGGTSKGPLFMATDLPHDPRIRDAVLLRAMGSPDWRQIDGLGGADSLTSKTVIISPSAREDADVDYLFAQVVVDRPIVDTSSSCGNMLSAIGPYAIEQGLVTASDPETVVRIYLVNIDALVEATVPTPGGQVTYEGDTAIDGVPGTAAAVKLAYVNALGAKTGKLLPTGNATDIIDGIEVSCVDMATLMVIARAEAFGKTGYEKKAELDADRDFFARLEAVRRQAGRQMDLGEVRDRVIPKFGIVSRPARDGSFSARFFVPTSTHATMAVTGAICLATASVIGGTVVHAVTRPAEGARRTVTVEHPSGTIAVELDVGGSADRPEIGRAAVMRTARRLFEGNVLIPSSVWDGSKVGESGA